MMKDKLRNIPGLLKFRYLLSAFRAPLPLIVKSNMSIKRYKNLYAGKRCFVIGNGPSLTPGDLDKIVGEYSFGANSIYKIYGKTKWRPTFFCVQDENVMTTRNKECFELSSCGSQASFIRMHSYHKIKKEYKKAKNPMLIPIWSFHAKNGGVPFSANADRVIFDGGTVTYMSIQLAAYMGFKEIYLMGCDHQMPFIWNGVDGPIVVDLKLASHFYDGAENNIGKDAHISRGGDFNATTKGYESAERYSRSHGFRIYNATRGGVLEVFERVDLDDVVGK